MARKWTDEALLDDARRFRTKADWLRGSASAYNTSLKRGKDFHARATAHMTFSNRKPEDITKEICMESASRHSRRSDWYKADAATYYAARKRGWFDECVAHMEPSRTGTRQHLPGHWTFERCLENFMACLDSGGSAGCWRSNSASAYSSAQRNGWLERIYAAADYEPKPWGREEWLTKEYCKQDALKYQTRADWDRASKSAYNKAQTMGWLDECCAHMERVNGHDNDAVYSWIVVEAPDHVVVPLPGYHLVKSGVTSQKLGDQRPRNTMRDNKMRGEIIGLCDTSEGDAPYFEQVLQSLGVQPVFPDDQPKVDGYTEMRLVSDAELDEIRLLLGASEGALAMAA